MTPDQWKSFHLMMSRLLRTVSEIYGTWVKKCFNLRDEEIR